MVMNNRLNLNICILSFFYNDYNNKMYLILTYVYIYKHDVGVYEAL